MPFGIIGRIEYIQRFSYFLPAIISIVTDADFAFLTRLGSYQNYTVGTTRTVDGGRRSVLQDGDIFDVGSGDVGNGFHGEAVNDEQRCVVTGDGAATTYTDLHFGIG